MMPRRALIVPLLLLTLTACGKPKENPSPVPVEAATEATLPADAAEGRPAWTASSKGIGPLTSTIPFDRAAIDALFPTAEVKAGFRHPEGVPTPIFRIEGPDQLAIEVQEAGSPGRVGEILVQGGPVVGPKGEQLLDRWKDMGFTADQCVTGADRFADAVLCRRPDAPELAYVFDVPGYDGNPGETPPETLLKEKGFLREFLWQAPARR